jgi:hypothetical protein
MNPYYSRQELESFAHGLVSMNYLLEQHSPDIILAPMMGAVPLIDCLNAVNPQFDNDKVFYVPASSSIRSLNNILPVTVSNILLEEKFANSPITIISIDEVVSGSSAVRVRKLVNEGFKRYAALTQGKDETPKGIQYLQIGLEHGIHKKSGKDWNEAYKKLRNNDKIIPLAVDRIITMDNPVLLTVRYVPKANDMSRNTPILEQDFKVSQEYLQLLREIAAYVGTPPDDARPRNFAKMLSDQRFVPDRYMQRS